MSRFTDVCGTHQFIETPDAFESCECEWDERDSTPEVTYAAHLEQVLADNGIAVVELPEERGDGYYQAYEDEFVHNLGGMLCVGGQPVVRVEIADGLAAALLAAARAAEVPA